MFNKKIMMIVASVALVFPLISTSNMVSANSKVNHSKIVKVVPKRHNSSMNRYYQKINRALNQHRNNYYYNKGFNDSLRNQTTHNLVNNKMYEKGYLQIIALDNYTAPSKRLPKHLSKSALSSAKIYYNHFIK